MRAITCTTHGGPEVLVWTEVDDPIAAAGEVIIDIEASAVNRADLLQRQGFYPPPPGASPIIGMECSGVVRALAADVDGWSVGDPVCALLAGGGYAEQVAVPVGQVMPVPRGVDLHSAAGLPEVACTVWSNLVMVAGLTAGQSALIHGGSSGIGTMAIQVAKALGASPIITTAGSSAKLERCTELGADVAINYRDDDFVEFTRTATEGRGVDVILDLVGARYLAQNIASLAPDGRLVVIGMQGGTRAELDLSAMLTKRATLHTTSLRSRPLAQKASICAAVVADLWPLISSGKIRPVIDSTVPMDRAGDAHELMAASTHIGKILLSRP